MLRKIIIIGLVVAIIGFLVFKIFSMANKKSNIEKTTASLPVFRFYNLQRQPFTNDSLHSGQSTALIYFNTDCEHCQYETGQIIKHAQDLQNTNLLMISRQSVQELKAFGSSYNISSFPFIKLLRDSTNVFYRTFSTGAVPSMFIYNKEGKFIKKYLGETKIENLIAAVHE